MMDGERDEQTEVETTEGPPDGILRREATRGDFLKWGTGAVGAMYAAPKVTSFTVYSRLGQAGSPAPGQHPASTSTGGTSVSPGASTLPRTGGGAGGGEETQWLPEAAAGAAAAGWYLYQRGKRTEQTEGTDDETEAEG